MDREKFVITDIHYESEWYKYRDQLIGESVTVKGLRNSSYAEGFKAGEIHFRCGFTILKEGDSRHSYPDGFFCLGVRLSKIEKEVDRKTGCGLPYGSLYKRKIKLKPRTSRT